ncbi:MAG: hypothetical protein ACKO1Q_05605 [Vulcanococcus sp.]
MTRALASLRSRAEPLRHTLIALALLLGLPALLLAVFPRRLATGLDRLQADAALLQSFAARPGTPPPPLWLERLGPQQAQSLWARQRRLWWQLWGPHGDAGSYLVLPAASGPAPAGALAVDDLWVMAPSPLARQLLAQQLTLQRRPSRGLDQRCTASLLQRTAVHWNGIALAQMLGPIAPLTALLQQGWVQLSGDGASLVWNGEADATAGTLTGAPGWLPPPASTSLEPPRLLALQGTRLDLLLRGLNASSLLRTTLAVRYGLGPEQWRRLKTAPFSLELRHEPQGPFRAGLQLVVDLPPDRLFWDRWLSDLSRSLERHGLERHQPLPWLTTWSRPDGTVVGGWRWLATRRLLWFLGPIPASVPSSAPLADVDWRLQLRPQALAQVGLLPEPLPLVVRRAQRLQLQGRLERGGASGGSQSSLSGRLELR